MPRAAKATRPSSLPAGSGRLQRSSAAVDGSGARTSRGATRCGSSIQQPPATKPSQRAFASAAVSSAYPSVTRATSRPRRTAWIAATRSRSRSSCVAFPTSTRRAAARRCTKRDRVRRPRRRLQDRRGDGVAGHRRVGRGQHLVPGLEGSGRRDEDVRLAGERAVERRETHHDGVLRERAPEERPRQGAAVIGRVEEKDAHRAGGHVLEGSRRGPRGFGGRLGQRATRDESAFSAHAAQDHVEERDRPLGVGREGTGPRVAAADRDGRRLPDESAGERLDPFRLDTRARRGPKRREARERPPHVVADRGLLLAHDDVREGQGQRSFAARRDRNPLVGEGGRGRAPGVDLHDAQALARGEHPPRPTPSLQHRRAEAHERARALEVEAEGDGLRQRSLQGGLRRPFPGGRHVEALRARRQQPPPGGGDDATRAPIEDHHPLAGRAGVLDRLRDPLDRRVEGGALPPPVHAHGRSGEPQRVVGQVMQGQAERARPAAERVPGLAHHRHRLRAHAAHPQGAAGRAEGAGRRAKRHRAARRDGKRVAALGPDGRVVEELPRERRDGRAGQPSPQAPEHVASGDGHGASPTCGRRGKPSSPVGARRGSSRSRSSSGRRGCSR